MEKNGTVMDYLRWRGDLTFAQDGFNEVDDLVLCIISYLNFRRFDDLRTTDPAKAVARSYAGTAVRKLMLKSSFQPTSEVSVPMKDTSSVSSGSR